MEDAKKFLDSNFKSDILTFAYPYTEVSPGLLYWVKRYDFAARGGRGDEHSLYIKSDSQPDWYNLPSQPSYTKYDAAIYKGWIDKDAFDECLDDSSDPRHRRSLDRIRADPQQHLYRISRLHEGRGRQGICGLRRSEKLPPTSAPRRSWKRRSLKWQTAKRSLPGRLPRPFRMAWC